MKKYIAPEVEIKRFAVENIMTDSTATVSVSTGDASTADVKADTVDYNTLFGIN